MIIRTAIYLNMYLKNFFKESLYARKRENQYFILYKPNKFELTQ